MVVVVVLTRYVTWFNESVCLCLQLADDRMALVSGISLDPEAAIGVTKKLPPKWVEGVDEVRSETGNRSTADGGCLQVARFLTQRALD